MSQSHTESRCARTNALPIWGAKAVGEHSLVALPRETDTWHPSLARAERDVPSGAEWWTSVHESSEHRGNLEDIVAYVIDFGDFFVADVADELHTMLITFRKFPPKTPDFVASFLMISSTYCYSTDSRLHSVRSC
jgi:hypothetical protein